MNPGKMLRRIKSKAVTLAVNQLLLPLSERLPEVMAPRMARAMGVPTAYGPSLSSNESIDSYTFLKRYCPTPRSGSTALDLGCGAIVQNPFDAEHLFGVDLCDIQNCNIKVADLNTEPLPFDSGQFNFVTAHDLFEHVLRVVIEQRKTRFPFIELMNEVDRVLASGGYLFSQTPAYPASEAFQDPTHVNFITANTFPYYFCTNNGTGRAHADLYGFKGGFELAAQCWSGCWLFTLIRKP